MPKQPPEISEHFRLVADHVPKEQVGEVQALFAKLGITELRWELVTNVVTFKTRRQHDVGTEEFLMPWIAEHATFRIRDAVAHCTENGRTAGACYTAVKIMVEKKILRKLSSGHYQRYDVKAIAGPKKPKSAPKITRDHFEVDHRQFILNYAKQHQGRINVAKLRTYFDLHGRKEKSVGGALGFLSEHKMIKSLGAGNYMLLAKGGGKPAEKVLPKGNGQIETQTSITPEEAMTNG